MLLPGYTVNSSPSFQHSPKVPPRRINGRRGHPGRVPAHLGNLPVLEHESALKNYLCKAVVNRCLNHLKRNEMLRRHHAEIFSSSEDSYVSTFVEEQELRLCIHAAIEQLPPKCREVFKLSRFGD